MNKMQRTASGAVDMEHYTEQAHQLRAQALKQLFAQCRAALRLRIHWRDAGNQTEYRSPGDCTG